MAKAPIIYDSGVNALMERELGFKIKTMIQDDKIQLMKTQPFFASVLQSKYIRVVSADDPFFTTAATDGRNIFINPLFMHVLGREKRLFVYCHEIWHTIFDTMGRRGDRNPKWFNIAADYSINQNLVNSGMVLPTTDDFSKFYRALVKLIGDENINHQFEKAMKSAEERGLIQPDKVAVDYMKSKEKFKL